MVVDEVEGGGAESSLAENGTEELGELPSSSEMSVNDFIREITEMMMGSFNISEFYVKLLKGLYLGIGFNRVIMSVVSVQPSKISLIGRFGLGDIAPEEVNKFEHVLAAGQYAMPNSLRLCKDMMVSGDKLSAFPDNLHYLVKGRNVFLFPICIDKKGIGMIYLDRKSGHPSLDKDEIKNVRLFRDFAVMAIKKLRKGK